MTDIKKALDKQLETTIVSAVLKGSLVKRVDDHISNLKYLSKSVNSKQKWFAEAIKEKIGRCKSSQNIFLEKNISVPISKALSKELESQIKNISAVKERTVTKREFFLEAIEEKLQKEESFTKKEVTSILN